MRLEDGRISFSPSDLNGFLACPHLSALDLAAALGELARPFRLNRHGDLIRTIGDQHEDAYLQRLLDEGRIVHEIHRPGEDSWDWERMARETVDAMRAGADVVYQAAFLDGEWRGMADFVVRLPDGSYEVVDAKLAWHARPAHVLQLCFYSEQVARILGRMPDAMHVVNGLGERESFRPGYYLAYYRRLRRRFLDAVAARADSYPYPVEHCGICDFLSLCRQQWEEDDHLVLVAGIARSQVEKVTAAGITTLEALGDAPTGTKIQKLRAPTFANVRHQAELQLHRRRTGEHRVDFLPVEEVRDFVLLPEPSAGDVCLDLEGHPWFEPARGLEYLFGWIELDPDGRPRYECLWLMGEHGTRESELDDLLRGEALVDLYRVTRHVLRPASPQLPLALPVRGRCDSRGSAAQRDRLGETPAGRRPCELGSSLRGVVREPASLAHLRYVATPTHPATVAKRRPREPRNRVGSAAARGRQRFLELKLRRRGLPNLPRPGRARTAARLLRRSRRTRRGRASR